MKIQFYPDDDVLYIDLSDKTSTESEEVIPGIVIDYDEDGNPVGIEISNASKLVKVDKLEISDLPLSGLILKKAA